MIGCTGFAGGEVKWGEDRLRGEPGYYYQNMSKFSGKLREGSGRGVIPQT